MPYLTQILLITSLIWAFLGGCTHKGVQISCEQANWFERGRRDGVIGDQPKKYVHPKFNCSSTDAIKAFHLYQNGYNMGLIEYCSSENGFTLGYAGHSLKKICPSQYQDDQRKSYFQGKTAHNFELSQSSLALSIKKIQGLLNTPNLELQTRQSLQFQLAKQKTKKFSQAKKLAQILNFHDQMIPYTKGPISRELDNQMDL